MVPKTLLTASFVAICSMVIGCSSKAGESVQSAQNVPDPPGVLKRAPGYRTVKKECTICHSEKLITQNRASREGWTDTIRWMQKNQGLRAFTCEEEKVILEYLAANYSPKTQGRRPPLVIREWYVLKP
ncbi:MAG: hypothetical protein ACU843_18230 [Gammaproteobacteria bacterium]